MCAHRQLGKAALLCGLVGWPIFAGAQPDPISILYHEPLAEVQMRNAADLRASAKPASSEADLRFTAFGRDFRLVLEPNDALARRLPSELQDAIELYRGRIEGASGSWARISRVGDELTGLIFDGTEYFAIDPLDRVVDRLVTRRRDNERTVIYRLNDTTGVLRDQILTPARPAADRGLSSKGNAALFMPDIVIGQQIEIGVVGDFEFTQLVGASEADRSLISLVNMVDGIFLQELGIHLDLATVEVYDTEPDPFNAVVPSSLLGELEGFKHDSAELRPLGLVHLVTGRTFPDSPSSETLGVANIGVLCEPRDGVGITRSRGSAGDAVVMAHEIGHNFGAPHDAEPGSACASAPPGKLMDAYINGSVEFSQCSVDQILIEVAGATCLTPLLPANMTLWLLSDLPPSIVEPDEAYEFVIAIENTSGVDAVDVEMIVDAPSIVGMSLQDRRGANPDNCEIFVKDRPYRCYWSEFSNGERFETAVSFRAREPGPATIDVSISSLTESDSTDDNLRFTVDVLPYVNLAAFLDPPGVSLRPDQAGAVTASIRNVGAVSANDVIARVTVGQRLEFLGASVGECVRTGDEYLISYDCPIGALAPGQAIDFVIDFRPRRDLSADAIKAGASLGLSVSSLEPEQVLDSQNNGTATRITLGDSIGDLAVDQLAAPRTFVGDTFLVFVDVRNEGPDTVHDVVVALMELSGSAGPTLTNLTAAGASCQLPLAAGDTICEIAQLTPGQEVSLTFSIVTESTGDFRFSLQSEMSSSDPDTTNDNSGSFVTVLPQPPAPPPPPSPPPQTAQPAAGGGGGGAMDLLALCLIGVMLFVARPAASAARGRRARAQ